MSDDAPVARLTCQLIKRPSVTPDDAGCQVLISEILANLGFAIEHLRFGAVDNLWAVRDRGGPILMFAGHTDVVPTGPVSDWRSDPFVPTVRDGYLYGRGSADMKGSLAAMLVATERWVAKTPNTGSLAFLLTSDEEGPAVDGTTRVVEELQTRGVKPDYCIIGEPSSSKRLGDVVRIGRRGSLNGHLSILGTMGHVAYPELADNPIHRSLPALDALVRRQWDTGNNAFPPTSLQISNIAAGTGASNIIPGTLEVDFNLRYCTEQTAAGLRESIETLLVDAGLNVELTWALSGEPFLTPRGQLLDAVTSAIRTRQGFAPELSTGGGTSDGRFIARLGGELIELGPVNDTIHQIDERVGLDDLEKLADLYLDVIKQVFELHA